MTSRPSSSILNQPPSAAQLPEMLSSAGTVWLDSSQVKGDWGTTSLIGRSPIGELIAGKPGDSSGVLNELDDIFERGGRTAVGYISYDAGLPWLGVKSRHAQAHPLMHFYEYVHLSDLETPPVLSAAAPHIVSPKVQVTETTSLRDYLAQVRSIQQHVREGDIYQANYTCRFDVELSEFPVTVYERLRQLNPGPYGAFLNFGDYQVLSSSPERLFRTDGRRVCASPVKGTIARNPGRAVDGLCRQLLKSDKDRAELLMITDLVRNDLGRIAEVGGVSVTNLFRTDVCSSVIHLVSDVEAVLAPSAKLSDLLKSMLPAGSITGAPKKRAVEIIDELEAVPRGVYTGCIGYVAEGVADFSVAIRTVTYRDGVYHIQAGGGIVADSSPEAEYREMRQKAANLFRAVGADTWAEMPGEVT